MILTATLLTGCHNNYELPQPKPPLSVPNARLKVALQTTPSAVRQMDPTTFTIRLSDGHGHPVDGATVTVQLVMPTMDMGKNFVVVHSQGSGVYAGSSRFSMDGDWDVVVTAAQGPEKAIQTFPLRVR